MGPTKEKIIQILDIIIFETTIVWSISQVLALVPLSNQPSLLGKEIKVKLL